MWWFGGGGGGGGGMVRVNANVFGYIRNLRLRAASALSALKPCLNKSFLSSTTVIIIVVIISGMHTSAEFHSWKSIKLLLDLKMMNRRRLFKVH